MMVNPFFQLNVMMAMPQLTSIPNQMMAAQSQSMHMVQQTQQPNMQILPSSNQTMAMQSQTVPMGQHVQQPTIMQPQMQCDQMMLNTSFHPNQMMAMPQLTSIPNQMMAAQSQPMHMVQQTQQPNM